MAKYIVYVSNDNGWFDECPCYEDVFFGGGEYEGGGEYVCDRDSEYAGGHVEFTDEAAAERFLSHLQSSGDWTNKATGEEERPEYAMDQVIVA